MNFVAMDFETANHQPYSACSLALVMVKNSQIVDEFYTLIQPETPFFLAKCPNSRNPSRRRTQCAEIPRSLANYPTIFSKKSFSRCT